MMLLMVLGSMSAGLVLMIGTEGQISRHYLAHTRLRYAAEAGLELGMERLRRLDDWSQVLVSAPSVGGPVRTPKGAPTWRLLAQHRLGALAGRGHDLGETIDVWIADDDDRDGDPSRDTNGQLIVRAEARGVDAGRYAVRAHIGRAGELDGRGMPRVLAWHADQE